MRIGRIKPGSWLMGAGTLMILAAFLLTTYNLWDERRAAADAGRILEQMPEPQEEGNDSEIWPEQNKPLYMMNPDMEMPTKEIEGNAYIGTLDLPTLGLSLPVMSEWSYPKLKIAPCRYTGTAYKSGFVIAAHNYQHHFGQISRLITGDPVRFTDMDGNVFEYQVDVTQVLIPTAIEEMIDESWDLSLFTCTLGGRTRLTVRCDRVTD